MSFACSTAIICPGAKSAWRCCAGIVGRRCRGSRSWFTIRTAVLTDMIAGEDAHQSERTLAIPLLQGAKPGQVWIADRHFCTRTLLTGWDTAGACIAGHLPAIVREHTNHPRLASRETWRDCGRTDTGTVREQEIALDRFARSWRCIELMR